LRYQKQWPDIGKEPAKGFDLSEPTLWKILGKAPAVKSTFSGRIIGGCLDTITCLVGTPFGALPAFNRRYQSDGVILYLENCELSPCSIARHIWQMRLADWFEGVNGIVLGRSAGPDANNPEHLSYVEALESTYRP
jgi:muramoyltetrapeptide carboxypeptidase